MRAENQANRARADSRGGGDGLVPASYGEPPKHGDEAVPRP